MAGEEIAHGKGVSARERVIAPAAALEMRRHVAITRRHAYVRTREVRRRVVAASRYHVVVARRSRTALHSRRSMFAPQVSAAAKRRRVCACSMRVATAMLRARVSARRCGSSSRAQRVYNVDVARSVEARGREKILRMPRATQVSARRAATRGSAVVRYAQRYVYRRAVRRQPPFSPVYALRIAAARYGYTTSAAFSAAAFCLPTASVDNHMIFTL